MKLTVKMLSVALAIAGLLTLGSCIVPHRTSTKSTTCKQRGCSARCTVRSTNPGLTYGNLCAMIYVFDNDQQLTECCGCVETHNGLRTLSVSMT